MFRLVVSVLTILGLMASQLVIVPHGHAGMTSSERAKHYSQAHFHVGHAHKHGHRHKHGHSHDHKSHHNKVANSSNAKPVRPHTEYPGSTDHDNTAIFVQVEAVHTAVNTEKDATPSAIDFVPLATIAGPPSDHLAAFNPRSHWHPPDTVLDDSEIYLTLRTLRN